MEKVLILLIAISVKGLISPKLPKEFKRYNLPVYSMTAIVREIIKEVDKECPHYF